MKATTYLFLVSVFFQATTGYGTTWTVSGLANTPGQNKTFFASEMKIRNPGTEAAEVSFSLLPVLGTSVETVTRTVVAGETLVLPNVLQELWGGGDLAGAARLTSTQDLLISARTYNNADPAGTFGLGLEVVRDANLLTAGETGHVGWISESPDGSKGFRTNVGIVLPTAGSAVDAIVYGTGGTELGRRTFSGGPLATQVSIRDIASGDLSVARLELRVTAGTATGYGAVVDNVTGDGFAVQPRRVTPGTWADLFLDGAAHAPGQFKTVFRTDARLVNPDVVPRRVTISGVSLVANGRPVTASTFREVPARGVIELNDVLGDVLGAPDGTSGSLRFETDGPLLVLGRTSNINPDGSTFGSVQRTTDASGYLSIGRTGVFIGLRESRTAPGFRTNVGFLSGPGGAVLDLVLRDRAGTAIVTRTEAVNLGAYVFSQPSLSELFPGTTIPDEATLEVTPTDGTVDVYTSFIDNGTGDPVIAPFTLPAFDLPASFVLTSPCAPKEGVAGGINAGTNLSRVDLDTNRHPEAVCNDGTPGVFYVRKGTGAGVNHWIVYLEGGGACLEGTACAQRWCSVGTNFGADKMSSRYAPARGVAGGGILATRADSAFSDFNKVWIYYCSSDAWTGRFTDRPLVDATGRVYSIQFEGSRILDAVITELRAGLTYRDAASDQPVALPSLDDASVILFAGESGGSSGVQRNADRLGAYFQQTNHDPARLVYRAVFDATNVPSNESFPLFESSSRASLRGFSVVVAGRIDDSCLSMHTNDFWRCGDGAHLRANHITTPFFARQDLIDSNTLDDFGTAEWPFGTQLYEYAQATWDHLDALSRIRSTAEEKAGITVDPGLYGPHCDNHTALRDNAKFFVDAVAKGGDLFTYHDTLRNWILAVTPSVVLQPRPTQEPATRSAVCTP